MVRHNNKKNRITDGMEVSKSSGFSDNAPHLPAVISPFLRFLSALCVAMVLMLFVRATCFTIYTIDGTALEPTLLEGDRVMVSRWSYGLRTGGHGSLFAYGRLCRQRISKGDIVAFDDPRPTTEGGTGGVLIGRCTAGPGDTVSRDDGQSLVVPSKAECADCDYYWMESLNPDSTTVDSSLLGPISEELIIGRAFTVIYSRTPDHQLFGGWRKGRFCQQL